MMFILSLELFLHALCNHERFLHFSNCYIRKRDGERKMKGKLWSEDTQSSH